MVGSPKNKDSILEVTSLLDLAQELPEPDLTSDRPPRWSIAIVIRRIVRLGKEYRTEELVPAGTEYRNSEFRLA